VYKHSLLIVDDEPHILSSLKRILEGEDIEILTAKDAEEARRVLQERGEAEVVICDNKLPGITGLEFLTSVRRLYPDMVMILLTGYPDLNSAITAINKANIWRYILKPIEVEELKSLVKQALDYNRILRENRFLLQIARKQAEWLKILKEKHPQMMGDEADKHMPYIIDEKRVSELVREFMKQYYPDSIENKQHHID